MRYYHLKITDPKTGKPPVDAYGNPVGPFDTSNTPGRGLHIEFDVMITGLDTVSSGTMLAIYGLPIDVLRQSVKLHGCQVSLIAGFTKGLPLADEHQQGEIINGDIYSAYANWVGTNQSLNLIINPAIRRLDNGKPLRISDNGRKGEKLGDVLTRALSKIYTRKKIICTVSNNLILPEDCSLEYGSDVSSLAIAVRSLSIATMRDNNYLGVGITMQSDTIRIYDNASVSWGTPKAIQGYELIGQPTWSEPFVMTFKCPLRGDLRCGDVIEMPQGMISGPSSVLMMNTTPYSAVPKDNVIFSGEFLITSVRHIGAFLVADGDAWATVYEAIAENWTSV
ncbi:hypothetical protein GC087_14420 [Pantoea sp. JZ2]|uniref:hypothetical protein n=1 Tax=Pantoea sp. JZ2 TaxID=2654189 RepID=UPI002B4A275C|nr:hypothetical protein [Pantoea sp. JZ2]WRH13726.1 hypothetical protein GC087_14420 [Pantoea sp. JZ2]